MLEIGTMVKLMERHKRGYSDEGEYIVENVTNRDVYLRKVTGYVRTVPFFDFQTQRFLLMKDGVPMHFPKPINYKQIDQKKQEREMDEYRNRGAGRSYQENIKRICERSKDRLSKKNEMGVAE